MSQGDVRRASHPKTPLPPGARWPVVTPQVSAELALKTHPNYRQVTFASGLFLEEPPPANTTASSSSSSGDGGGGGGGDGGAPGPRLLISYGSGDAASRVLALSLEEVERLFLLGPQSSGAGQAQD